MDERSHWRRERVSWDGWAASHRYGLRLEAAVARHCGVAIADLCAREATSDAAKALRLLWYEAVSG